MHQPQNNQNDKSSIVAFRTFGRLAKGTKQAKYLLCLNIALHSLDLNWAHTNTGLKHSSRECGTCKHTNTQTEYKCTSTKQLKDYTESHRLKLAVTQQAVCCALCRKTCRLKDLYLLWCSPPRRSFIANISRSFGRRWTCQKVPACGQAPLWAFQKTDNHLYDHHHHHFLCSNIAISFRIAIFCRMSFRTTIM